MIASGLALGCGAATSGESATETLGTEPATTRDASGSSSTGETGTSGTTGEPAPPTACAAETTVTGSPRSIGEAVEFINALPRPVTLECFLERLERPLAVAATSSIISLQPAAGDHSPRLFFFNGDLVMSIAVGGDHGFYLLEFGEHVTPTDTIKAELEFPITEEVPLSAPFERVYNGEDGTGCAICHRGETAVPNYPGAFASDALRFPDLDEVKLSALRGEHERCDPSLQPERCARLRALFSHGEVEQGGFPPEMPTIFDYE